MIGSFWLVMLSFFPLEEPIPPYFVAARCLRTRELWLLVWAMSRSELVDHWHCWGNADRSGKEWSELVDSSLAKTHDIWINNTPWQVARTLLDYGLPFEVWLLRKGDRKSSWQPKVAEERIWPTGKEEVTVVLVKVLGTKSRCCLYGSFTPDWTAILLLLLRLKYSNFHGIHIANP